MNLIGERIKQKRKLLNMYLNELAAKVDVSPSALSQIEKGKSYPSVLTLKAIAEALHTTIGELVGENDTMTNNPVVLKTDIKYVEQNSTGTIIFLLSNHDTNKLMDTYLVRFANGGGLDGLIKTNHGQIFCHVISGQVRFDLADKSHILNQGDNIYFNAKTQFNAINSNNGLSELIWVQSPPNY